MNPLYYLICIVTCGTLLGAGCVSARPQKSIADTGAVRIPNGPMVQIPDGYRATESGSVLEISGENGRLACIQAEVVSQATFTEALQERFKSHGVATCSMEACITEEGQSLLISQLETGIFLMKLPPGIDVYTVVAKSWGGKIILITVCSEERVEDWAKWMNKII